MSPGVVVGLILYFAIIIGIPLVFVAVVLETAWRKIWMRNK